MDSIQTIGFDVRPRRDRQVPGESSEPVDP